MPAADPEDFVARWAACALEASLPPAFALTNLATHLAGGGPVDVAATPLGALAASNLGPHASTAAGGYGGEAAPGRLDLLSVRPAEAREPDLLGRAHEALLDGEHRRRHGVFYTPPVVAEGLVERVLPPPDPTAVQWTAVEAAPPTVCDPAVGGGAFLLAAARALEARGHPRHRIVAEALWGVDIDPLAVAVAATALVLWAAAADRPGTPDWHNVAADVLAGVEAHVVVGDPLLDGPDVFAGAHGAPGTPGVGGFDAVVGNPPFQNQLGRATAHDPTRRDALRRRFGAAAYRYTDSAALFLLEAVRWTRPGGRAGLVVPQSVLVAADAVAARRALLATAELEQLWVAGTAVFAVGVRVCAPVLRVLPPPVGTEEGPDHEHGRDQGPEQGPEQGREPGHEPDHELDHERDRASGHEPDRASGHEPGSAPGDRAAEPRPGERSGAKPGGQPGRRAERRPDELVLQRWRGAALTPAPPVVVSRAGLAEADTWGPLVADLFGLPNVVLPGTATLVDLASATAGFRDQFYGLRPYVREAVGAEAEPGAPGVARLVTSGLVEPAVSAWGRRPTRFAGQRLAAPVVELDRLAAGDPALAAWTAERLRPKVVVAAQTRVVEAAVDEDGTWFPSVPVVAVTPAPDDLWAVAAVLLAPAVSAWVLGRHGGAALSGDAIKVSARQVLALPLPGRRRAWAATEAPLRRAAAATTADGWRDALAEAGARMGEAYGTDDDVLTWWLARLPRFTPPSTTSPSSSRSSPGSEASPPSPPSRSSRSSRSSRPTRGAATPSVGRGGGGLPA